MKFLDSGLFTFVQSVGEVTKTNSTNWNDSMSFNVLETAFKFCFFYGIFS